MYLAQQLADIYMILPGLGVFETIRMRTQTQLDIGAFIFVFQYGTAPRGV